MGRIKDINIKKRAYYLYDDMVNIEDFDSNLLKLEVKYQVEGINDSKSGEYGKDYMKIKFSSDDDLPLNKRLKFMSLAILVRTVFEEDGKYYPQI